MIASTGNTRGQVQRWKKTKKIDKNLEAKSKHQEGTQRAKSVGWTDFMWEITIITRSRQMNIRGGKLPEPVIK